MIWLNALQVATLVVALIGMRVAYNAGRARERVIWMESWPHLPSSEDS